MSGVGRNLVPVAALAGMAHQAPVGHVLIDRAMVVRYANPRACAILGVDCAGLAGRPLAHVVRERSLTLAGVERVMAVCAQVLASGKPVSSAAWRLLRPEGGPEMFCDWEIHRLDAAGSDGPYLALAFSDVTDHVLARRDLDRSEARWRMMVEQVEDYAVFSLDPGGVITAWNIGAERILGYREAEIVGRPAAIVFTPEDVAAGVPEREIERAIRTGRAVNERWHLRRDGTRLYAVGMLTAIRDRNGDLAGFSKIFRDRTAQQQAAEALRISEERFRLLVGQMRDYAIFFTDPERRVTQWTPSAERMLGWTSEEITGRTADTIFTEADLAAGEPQREADAATAHGQSADKRWHRCKEEELVHIDGVMVALRDGDGGLTGFAKLMLDDTERVHLEEDLRATTRRFALAQRAAGIGVFELDLADGRLMWSAELAHLYGIDPANAPLTTAAWSALILSEHASRVESEWRQAIGEGRPWRSEFRIRRGDGAVRWISAAAEVVSEDTGAARRLLGTNIDVTERKEALDALAQANRDLEQFAAVTSHDLQEPLRMVSGYLDLIRRRAGDLDPVFAGYVAKAIDGSARMQRLIRHILDLARIGSTKVVPRAIDSTGAFVDAMANLGQLIEDTGAVVTHGPLPNVRAEYEHLVRLFQNLVGNGIKYRRAGVLPQVSVSAIEREDAWEFAITDNGAGIPDVAREAIFTIFVRLADLADNDGAGLGLAICKRIVDRHHGRIWVESEVGTGSIFWFTLPKARGETLGTLS